MTTLCIPNWDKWQTYRKDRGTPPWIKIHRNLLSSPKWAVLNDSEKGQLVSIWIVAADKMGRISDNPRIIQKICQLDSEPNINNFIELGFLSTMCQPVDNHMTTTRQQHDAPETETETDKKEHMSDSDEPDVEYLKARKAYKPKNPNDNNKKAFKAWKARIRSNTQPADLIAGINRYSAYCIANNTPPQKIMHMSTFLNADESWKMPWKIQGKVPSDELSINRLIREHEIDIPQNCGMEKARHIIARAIGMQA